MGPEISLIPLDGCVSDRKVFDASEQELSDGDDFVTSERSDPYAVLASSRRTHHVQE